MKKLLLLIALAFALLFTFSSCTKEDVEPNIRNGYTNPYEYELNFNTIDSVDDCQFLNGIHIFYTKLREDSSNTIEQNENYDIVIGQTEVKMCELGCK